MTAVANSGPLIVLAKINHLHLLPALYDEVLIPQSVYYETVITGQTRGYPDAKILQAFLTKMGWQPVEPAENVSGLETTRLGRGEYEAIALAWQYRSLLLVDEVYARAVADRLGLQTVGSLGILVEAFRKGIITADLLEELLITIEDREDIWIHPDLCRFVRREVLRK